MFLILTAAALVVFYFYKDEFFIPCLAVAAVAFASALVSLACCCVRRRASATQTRTITTIDEKEAEKIDYLNIEDPLLRKAITHFHYRCCEEAWQATAYQTNSFQPTKRVFPVRKSPYQYIPSTYRRSFQSGYYP